MPMVYEEFLQQILEGSCKLSAIVSDYVTTYCVTSISPFLSISNDSVH